MTVADGISLGITIGLGIVSIVLGVFAIWLSHRFAQESTSALSVLRDVAAQIKALTETGISHQSDFSSKMLDSILDKRPYGPSDSLRDESETFKKMMEKSIGEFEKKIFNKVDTRILKSIKESSMDQDALKNLSEEIRIEMKSFVDEFSNFTQNLILPHDLKEYIKEWKKYAGMAILGTLITREDARSKNDIEKSVPAYNLPYGWESAIDTLLKDGILIGDASHFEIADKYKRPLELWVARNSNQLDKIISIYGMHFQDEEGRANKVWPHARELTI